MRFRRLVPIVLIVTLTCATCPAPTRAATSTATEVQMGEQYDKQIVATQTIVTDPLLVAWVDDVGGRVWRETERKDVPYSVKIIDTPEINAFSTLGGFIYVNAGLLDFAQSDDELAGVLGHETGHIERRHVLQNQNKAAVLNILMGVASMFVPFVSRFGQLAEAGVMARIQRDDEYQADKTGLLLETRAGYDPNAMVSFMRHLGAVEDAHNSLIDKYLQDHPDVPKRVGALVGYPQLDPKVVTEAQRLTFALHDEDETRYAIAAREYASILAADPANVTAREHLATVEVALGAGPAPAQTIAAAPAIAPPLPRSAMLPAAPHADLLHVDLQPLRDRVGAEQALQETAAAAIAARRSAARDQLKGLRDREDFITYGMPNTAGAVARPGSRLEAVIANLQAMSRALEATNSKAGHVIDGVGSAAEAKSGGLLRIEHELLAQLAAQLDATPPTPAVRAAYPLYPRMLTALQSADGDLLRSIDAARVALAELDLALGDLDAFVRALSRSQLEPRGDIYERDYANVEPLMAKALSSLNRSAVTAAQAQQLFDMARARQAMVRIDALGLGSSPERYATLTRSLDRRFKNATIDYRTMVQTDLAPSDVVAASIVAADTATTPEDVIAESRRSGRSIVDVANARGMQALALEIFLKLVTFDYTDDPDQEAHALV